jgi:Fe/S biogenesis protein NfuA
MMGGCQGCAASAMTLRQGIERMVREEIPEVRDIVDLTDHDAGANPYY